MYSPTHSVFVIYRSVQFVGLLLLVFIPFLVVYCFLMHVADMTNSCSRYFMALWTGVDTLAVAEIAATFLSIPSTKWASFFSLSTTLSMEFWEVSLFVCLFVCLVVFVLNPKTTTQQGIGRNPTRSDRITFPGRTNGRRSLWRLWIH